MLSTRDAQVHQPVILVGGERRDALTLQAENASFESDELSAHGRSRLPDVAFNLSLRLANLDGLDDVGIVFTARGELRAFVDLRQKLSGGAGVFVVAAVDAFEHRDGWIDRQQNIAGWF